MKLAGSTLKKLFKGAIYFETERGWLTPYRYSKAQLDYMAQPGYDWGWRFRAKIAGCSRIELKTDSTKISFKYKASDYHERANTFDLYVNGELRSVYKIDKVYNGKVEFSLPEGTKKVCIYMPCESIVKIKDFTLDGTYTSIKEKGSKLLIFGDSITQGAGPAFAGAAYANELQRMTKMNVLAQGIGGYRFEPCDLMTVDGFEPDKLLIFLGTNYYDEECLERYDYGKAVKEYFELLVKLYPTTPIYVITPLWRNNGVIWDRFYWCIKTIKEACAQYKSITVADGFDFVPNADDCFSDGVHPNAYGSYHLAKNLAKFICGK